jgi:hypothetical protein
MAKFSNAECTFLDFHGPISTCTGIIPVNALVFASGSKMVDAKFRKNCRF